MRDQGKSPSNQKVVLKLERKTPVHDVDPREAKESGDVRQMGQELRDGIRRRMPSEAWQARGYESQSHHQEYRRDVRWFQARGATQEEAAAILEPIIRAVERMRDHKPRNDKEDFDAEPSKPA